MLFTSKKFSGIKRWFTQQEHPVKLYIVTIADRHPAAGEVASTIEVEAANKKEAVAKARKLTPWRSRFDSPVTYRAVEA